MHPVRARLLERARMTRPDATSGGTSSHQPWTPDAQATATGHTAFGPPPKRELPVGPLDLTAVSHEQELSRGPSLHHAPDLHNEEHLDEEPRSEASSIADGSGEAALTAAPSSPPQAQAPLSARPLPVPSRPLPPPARPAPARAVLDSAPESDASPAPTFTPAPGAVMDELERIARRSPSRTAGPSLSPNLSAGLIGLVGTTLIATLGLLLAKAERGAPPQPAPVASAVASAEAEVAPVIPAVQRTRVAGPWRVMDDADKPGHQVLRGRIGKQAFLRAIQDAGLPKTEAYRAYTALKGLLDLDHCKSSDEFLALVSTRGKTLLGFEYIISKEEVVQARPNAGGLLTGQKLDLKVVRNQVRRAFAHDGKSFEESARRGGFDPGIAHLVGAALRGHSALSDFKAGDRMRIIVQEVTVLGEFSRYAGIEAMEILKAGQEPRRIYYYSHPVEGGHFDTTGRAPYEGGWRLPIPGAPVTSKFNMKRMHPVLHKPMPHTGTDFGAPTGTPIGATSPGIVSFIGNGGPSGNLVKVKHDGGYESGYAHLSRFMEGLKVGDAVERMQTVGYCGSTGRSTGPHLHFTMKKDGVFIDPESLNLDGMRVISKAHREAFAEVRAKYDPILDAIPLPEPIAAAPAAAEPVSAGDDEQDMEADLGPSGPAASSAPGQPSGTSAPSAAAPAQPAQVKPPTAAATQPAQPAQAVAPSAIFLSDEELLKMQSVRHPGEVSN